MKKQSEQLEFDFVEKVLSAVDYTRQIDKLSYKDLADFLIYEYPKEYTLGTKGQVVLDRVILILHGLDDKKSECCCKS